VVGPRNVVEDRTSITKIGSTRVRQVGSECNGVSTFCGKRTTSVQLPADLCSFDLPHDSFYFGGICREWIVGEQFVAKRLALVSGVLHDAVRQKVDARCDG
jgi:hypothetical protein